jgi:CRISPR-associated protein Cas2
MDILVTYDVAIDTPEGVRRLRRVAQDCKRYGQRVQKSVFECTVDDMTRAKLTARLLKHIDPEKDSLRIYRLPSPRERNVEVHGLDYYVDFEAPLLV